MLSRWSRLSLILALISIGLAVVPGCDPGDDDRISTTEVSGRVLLDGQAVVDAKVVFIPIRLYDVNGAYRELAYALTGEGGEFTLKTASGEKLIRSGLHRVVISKGGESDPLDGATDGAMGGVALAPFLDRHDGFRQPLGEEIPVIYNRHTILTFNIDATKDSVRANFELSSIDPLLK